MPAAPSAAACTWSLGTRQQLALRWPSRLVRRQAHPASQPSSGKTLSPRPALSARLPRRRTLSYGRRQPQHPASRPCLLGPGAQLPDWPPANEPIAAYLRHSPHHTTLHPLHGPLSSEAPTRCARAVVMTRVCLSWPFLSWRVSSSRSEYERLRERATSSSAGRGVGAGDHSGGGATGGAPSLPPGRAPPCGHRRSVYGL
jgi:hypothetical protein